MTTEKIIAMHQEGLMALLEKNMRTPAEKPVHDRFMEAYYRALMQEECHA